MKGDVQGKLFTQRIVFACNALPGVVVVEADVIVVAFKILLDQREVI